MLVKLSSRISTEQDLRALGIVGLKMEHHVVQKHLTNNCSDITNEADSMLIEWRKSKSDARIAHTMMGHGLIDSGLMNLIHILTD